MLFRSRVKVRIRAPKSVSCLLRSSLIHLARLRPECRKNGATCRKKVDIGRASRREADLYFKNSPNEDYPDFTTKRRSGGRNVHHIRFFQSNKHDCQDQTSSQSLEGLLDNGHLPGSGLGSVINGSCRFGGIESFAAGRPLRGPWIFSQSSRVSTAHPAGGCTSHIPGYSPVRDTALDESSSLELESQRLLGQVKPMLGDRANLSPSGRPKSAGSGKTATRPLNPAPPAASLAAALTSPECAAQQPNPPNYLDCGSCLPNRKHRPRVGCPVWWICTNYCCEYNMKYKRCCRDCDYVPSNPCFGCHDTYRCNTAP